jgi:hypothetical protein
MCPKLVKIRSKIKKNSWVKEFVPEISGNTNSKGGQNFHSFLFLHFNTSKIHFATDDWFIFENSSVSDDIHLQETIQNINFLIYDIIFSAYSSINAYFISQIQNKTSEFAEKMEKLNLSVKKLSQSTKTWMIIIQYEGWSSNVDYLYRPFFVKLKWNFHLEQTMVHLCRPIIILSDGWISSLVVEDYPQWLIIIPSIMDGWAKTHLLYIVHIKWISSALNEHHLSLLNIIQNNSPLFSVQYNPYGMIINHWVWWLRCRVQRGW